MTPRQSFVYFIKPIGMDGPIKIGFSRNVGQRLELLERSAPFRLEICAQIEGDKPLERRFHALFHYAHCHNEWFRPVEELLEVIGQLKDGAFDTTTLPPPLYFARPSRHWLAWSIERQASRSSSSEATAA